MEYLLEIYEIVKQGLDFKIVLLVLAIGQLVKKYWSTSKINAFFKVLIFTLPLTVSYCVLAQIPAEKAFLSYLVSFWIYPFIAKWLFKKTGLGVESKIGGELPDTDDEG